MYFYFFIFKRETKVSQKKKKSVLTRDKIRQQGVNDIYSVPGTGTGTEQLGKG